MGGGGGRISLFLAAIQDEICRIPPIGLVAVALGGRSRADPQRNGSWLRAFRLLGLLVFHSAWGLVPGNFLGIGVWALGVFLHTSKPAPGTLPQIQIAPLSRRAEDVDTDGHTDGLDGMQVPPRQSRGDKKDAAAGDTA